MATGTQAVTTVGSSRDLRVQGALGVLLVALGVVTGLLIGGMVRQDESALAGESQAVIGQPARLDDYALRHPGANALVDSVTHVGALNDYALRHTPAEAGIRSDTEAGAIDDYALRHTPSEAGFRSATQVNELDDYPLRHAGETP